MNYRVLSMSLLAVMATIMIAGTVSSAALADTTINGVSHVFVKTDKVTLNINVVAPPGKPGANGTNGKDGAQGIQGVQGIQGIPGPAGNSTICFSFPNGTSSCIPHPTPSPTPTPTPTPVPVNGTGNGTKLSPPLVH